jgi:hypothetical protein
MCLADWALSTVDAKMTPGKATEPQVAEPHRAKPQRAEPQRAEPQRAEPHEPIKTLHMVYIYNLQFSIPISICNFHIPYQLLWASFCFILASAGFSS